MSNPTVPERLRAAAALFEERNAAYGGNYLHFGEVMYAMFPKGVSAKSPSEMRRLVLFVHLVTKMTRYAENMKKGQGHADSLEDLAVYAMMCAECDTADSVPKTPVPIPAAEALRGLGIRVPSGLGTGADVPMPDTGAAAKYEQETHDRAASAARLRSIEHLREKEMKHMTALDGMMQRKASRRADVEPADESETGRTDEWSNRP